MKTAGGQCIEWQGREAASAMRAELRFLGAEEHTSSSALPAVFVLTPEQPKVDVGRDVASSEAGLRLDSPHQKLMISRAHARISFAPAHRDKDGRSIPGQWRVADLGSTNGLLFNGCRVMEAKVARSEPCLNADLLCMLMLVLLRSCRTGM